MKNYNTLGKYKDAETVIVDGQGWYHDGYFCRYSCSGCPYAVPDINGNLACYGEDYHKCKKEH